MKRVRVFVARQIKVIRNSSKGAGDQWAEIKDAHTGKTLHRGQLYYIRKTAEKRYNTLVNL